MSVATHTTEHRSNGKTIRNGHMNGSAREAAEKLFKKPKPSDSPDTPAASPPREEVELPIPDKNKVALSITHGSIFQANFVISRHLWDSIGKPKRVDITGTPETGYSILGGALYKVQLPDRKNKKNSKGGLIVSVSARKLQLPQDKRDQIKREAELKNGLIFMPPLPAYWVTGKDPSDTQPETPEPTTVIPDLSPQIGEAHSDIGTITARKNSAGITIVFAVPATLLSRLGDPKRLLVTGKCQHGFEMKPVEEGGVKLNYETGKNVYVAIGGSDRGLLTKDARKPFSVRMTIEKDGSIKVSGPSYEWIRGINAYLKNPPPPAPLAHAPNVSISAHMGSGGGTSPPARNGFVYQIPDTAGVPELQAHIGQLLGALQQAKAGLEAKTGMKFTLSRDLRLVAQIDIPQGFVPPNQQRDTIKLTG